MGHHHEAETKLEGLLSQLAREGALSTRRKPGMILHATTVVEFVGDDGDTWWAILGLPMDKPRDAVVHRWLLDEFIRNFDSEDE